MKSMYQLNTDFARQGDSRNTRIDTTGAYAGYFNEVRYVTSKKGTKGIEFKFVCDATDQTAEYMTIWTHNKDGDEIYGFKKLHALMCCAKVRELTKVDGIGKVWEDGKQVEKSIEICPELTNIPIGVVLQKEWYTKNNGQDAYRMQLHAFYNHESKLMATEMLDKSDSAQELNNLLDWLDDEDNRVPTSFKPDLAAVESGNTPAKIDFDDDVPF